MSTPDIELNGPQALYRNWEESQWSPFTVELSADRGAVGAAER